MMATIRYWLVDTFNRLPNCLDILGVGAGRFVFERHEMLARYHPRQPLMPRRRLSGAAERIQSSGASTRLDTSGTMKGALGPSVLHIKPPM